MEIEIKRKVKKEVEETVIVELKKYWVVRIIQGECGKSCIAEKEFDYVPTEQEIADTLAPYLNRKCFATVAENYRFVERVEGEQKMFDKGLKTEEVKKMLEERNVSVREFADATNTTETAMNWYLSGKRIPRGTIVVNMATFLGCKVEDIYI